MRALVITLLVGHLPDGTEHINCDPRWVEGADDVGTECGPEDQHRILHALRKATALLESQCRILPAPSVLSVPPGTRMPGPNGFHRTG